MPESFSAIALQRLRFAMEEQPQKEKIGIVLNSAETKAFEMISRGGEAAKRGDILLTQIEAARRLLVRD